MSVEHITRRYRVLTLFAYFADLDTAEQMVRWLVGLAAGAKQGRQKFEVYIEIRRTDEP